MLPKLPGLAYLVLLIGVVEIHGFRLKREDKSLNDLVPEFLDYCPDAVLTVEYNGKEIEIGQELTPSEVRFAPKVFWESDPNKFYTLLMYDPDAPSRTNTSLADAKHWLIVNIPGDEITIGEVIAEYYGPGPPQGTGLHRYIFVVYEQFDRMEFDEPYSKQLSRANRLRFDVEGFLEKYGLIDLVAANYFLAQWEPYVIIRNRYILD